MRISHETVRNNVATVPHGRWGVQAILYITSSIPIYRERNTSGLS